MTWSSTIWCKCLELWDHHKNDRNIWMKPTAGRFSCARDILNDTNELPSLFTGIRGGNLMPDQFHVIYKNFFFNWENEKSSLAASCKRAADSAINTWPSGSPPQLSRLHQSGTKISSSLDKFAPSSQLKVNGFDKHPSLYINSKISFIEFTTKDCFLEYHQR